MNSLKAQIVAALAGLYPRRWKREYGSEFADVLIRSPLGPSAVLNIAWNALRQQLRLGEPWLIVGIPWLLLNLYGHLWNILYPVPYAADPSSNSLAARAVAGLLPLAIGYWTVLRDQINGHGGRAAMKYFLLIQWPICALAILWGLGILRIIVLGPGDPPSTFHEHGFAYTFYDYPRRPIHWQLLFWKPFGDLPFMGVLGWLGGLAARAQARFPGRRRSPGNV
ncbi:MAG TPA: hypothetical protein VFQ79_11645 [Bryobacteraceae bacterium]|nr:hypothetical protein [Bryobacteraceae bacterium]